MAIFCRRNFLFLAMVVSLFALTSGQDGSGDYEDYSESGSVSQQSESASLPIDDRNPCSFRGQFLTHGQSVVIDPCTECVCKNGTTTCNIESCPSEQGCLPDEIVIIPEECCPQCPYKMIVDQTENQYGETFDFAIGETKRIRFGANIALDKKQTSRLVRGESMWKLGAWISPNEDGSGRRTSYKKQVITGKDKAKEYFKGDYNPPTSPWDFKKMKFTMDFTNGECADFKFFCIEFGPDEAAQPKYDLDFTVLAKNDEEERLRDCIPLGQCSGVFREQSSI